MGEDGSVEVVFVEALFMALVVVVEVEVRCENLAS